MIVLSQIRNKHIQHYYCESVGFGRFLMQDVIPTRKVVCIIRLPEKKKLNTQNEADEMNDRPSRRCEVNTTVKAWVLVDFSCTF
jgi:hypothetical protein